MAANTVIELIRSFDDPPLTGDQAERFQTLQKAATSFAVCLQQALIECPARELAIDHVRLSLALARQAVGVESRIDGESLKQRRALVEAIEAGTLTAKQRAKLAALLGVLPDEDDDQPTKAAGGRRKRQAEPSNA